MDMYVRIAVALAISSHIVSGRSYNSDIRHENFRQDYPTPHHHHPPGQWHHDPDWKQSRPSPSFGRPSYHQRNHRDHKYPHDNKDWNHHHLPGWDSGSWEYPDFHGHGTGNWGQHEWGDHGKPNQWPQHHSGSSWPNRPTWDQERPSNTAPVKPQTSPRATTNDAQDLLAQTLCIRSCPVTSEYNPVCGTNNVTYGNPGRLECAKFCGVDVSLGRNSACPIQTIATAQTTTTAGPVQTTSTPPPPVFVTPTQFTTVEIPAIVPTDRPAQTNPPFTIPQDIINSIFTSTTTEDDQHDIDIRTRSRFKYA